MTVSATSNPTKQQVRTKGQVWTPTWVADAMALYVLEARPAIVHEPSVGGGALVEGLARVGSEIGHLPVVHGTELHPDHLGDLEQRMEGAGLSLRIETRDFLDLDDTEPIEAIIANPPYIRHHRFDEVQKTALQRIAETTIGTQIDRRTGYHAFFLLRAIARMQPDARGAFIIPADIFEGMAARTMMERISAQCRIDAVITFAPEATPFPRVDTNPVILLFRKGGRTDQIAWAYVQQISERGLLDWVAADLPAMQSTEIESFHRPISEALRTGFTRRPRVTDGEYITLGDLLSAVRGIATGSNDFFVLTAQRARELGIPASCLRRCVRRTRDVNGDVLHFADLEALEAQDAPTHLLYLGGDGTDEMTPELQAYLATGEAIGQAGIAATRSPWWRMERRDVPPILFAYLGRENSRFIRNAAKALPLNGFLCIYPHAGIDADALLALLNDARTIAALRYEGKSYGDGAIKVEPNAIERVLIPCALAEEYGVTPGPRQMNLFA